ncbi:MAG TPA: hypothetical protein VFY10_06120 [Dehalococcoidia bacterium]|nr:hypothetical protein [Dehalococcoidia bacterium]
MSLKTGDFVWVTSGRYVDFVGALDEIDMEKGEVKVSFFCRETPIELDFLQVKKL